MQLLFLRVRWILKIQLFAPVQCYGLIASVSIAYVVHVLCLLNLFYINYINCFVLIGPPHQLWGLRFYHFTKKRQGGGTKLKCITNMETYIRSLENNFHFLIFDNGMLQVVTEINMLILIVLFWTCNTVAHFDRFISSLKNRPNFWVVIIIKWSIITIMK